MPVILDRRGEERWIQGDDVDELQAMLDPYPDGQMQSYGVSTAVNHPANDGPELVDPVATDQSGLGAFG